MSNFVKENKNTLLAASGVVAAGVVGALLYSYVQKNKRKSHKLQTGLHSMWLAYF